MRPLLILGLFALYACAGPSHPGEPGNVNQGVLVQPDKQFEISVGQEARVTGTSITVRFTAVTEDSRCPVDVECVWAGNAVVRLTLSSPGKASADVSLNTTLDPKSASFEGHVITLRGLKPQPRSGSTIPGSSYAASLEVSR